jgi:hypothetical protein
MKKDPLLQKFGITVKRLRIEGSHKGGYFVLPNLGIAISRCFRRNTLLTVRVQTEEESNGSANTNCKICGEESKIYLPIGFIVVS